LVVSIVTLPSIWWITWTYTIDARTADVRCATTPDAIRRDDYK
jgi:hypothetical protein